MAITIPKRNPFAGISKRLDTNVQQSLFKAGDILIKESKVRVPVKTGLLRSSLDFIITRITGGWRLIYGSGTRLGAEINYAKYQEFGTRYIKPVRYLRGSRDANYQKVQNLIRSAIRKAFKI